MAGPRNRDLHGAAPERSADVLLVLDMISDFGFPGATRILRAALPVAHRIARLKQRAAAAGVPVIFVNDNRGRWRSDFSGLLGRALAPGSRGAPIARVLAPGGRDYFVIKPKHSGFFVTVLETLLEYLEARRLILTGAATDQCVLFTANDAYVRDYELAIPRDCVAADSMPANRLAFRYFKEVLGADLRPSARIRLARTRRPKR
jgi:nicotinamidase-related amidase